jgi:hypothetical protein
MVTITFSKINFSTILKVFVYHNIFANFGTWEGGKEKAPAACAVKLLKHPMAVKLKSGEIGSKRVLFLYIDECLEEVRRLMESNVQAGEYRV